MKKIGLIFSFSLLILFTCCQKHEDLQKDPNGFLNVESKSYFIGASGGCIDIPIETNMQYVVSIPSESRDWISTTPSSISAGMLQLFIAKNSDTKSRSSVIKLTDNPGNTYAEVTISQKGYIPANQIFYTSTDDGKVIPASAQNQFGPGFTIISNTYLNGEGVITFDGDITMVGNSSFHNCSNLKTIILPDKITTVGNSAFSGCTALLDISLPSELLSIGQSAFKQCSSLTEITLPGSVTEIGRSAFESCVALTEMTIPESITLIEQGLFDGCSSLRDVFLHDGIASIGNYAFRDCSSLTGISLPDELSVIGDDAFYKCTALAELTLPDQLSLIGESAFYNCTSLTAISIPGSVVEIGDFAFANCKSFTTLSIPASVEKVGDYVASGCTCDFYVYPPQNATCDPLRGGGSNPVQGFCGYVIVPDDATFIPEEFGCDCMAKGYKGKYASEDNHCLIYNGTLIDYARGDGGSSYMTPKGIKRIGREAFSGTYMVLVLSNLRISEGVEEISYNALGFHLNDFNVIELPASLKKIDANAFLDCAHLQYICCQAQTPPALERSFKFATNVLKTIYVPEESVAKYQQAEGWNVYGNRIKGATWKDEHDSPIFSDEMWPY